MTAPSLFTRSSDDILVRPAVGSDLTRLGVLAGALVRQHHGYDAARFILPPNVEDGYRRFFGRELAEEAAILLVATRRGEADAEPLGYAYGRVEPRDWNMLLGPHAALHDLFVVAEARGLGAGEALVRTFADVARARGVPRIVLHSASANTSAQRLFTKLGFRPTMLEMTCELEPEGLKGASA